ncbi:hypothetical protein [Spiroplasma tabanidicola]|uniref:N-acetyltransferase domain-containing protein n=1 Tax=Spiroplasma tabanidicola TaxID=324079 RepID=A0A6I6C3U1_9MOLU|nr:hypothetical protein [Spiroplasma tabanidicola]QGS51477.1 hypothetical protein STABA_v1c01100 [Spiroplasma tabanidicola]
MISKKASENYEAFLKYDENNKIKAFLMLQIKDEPENDILPIQPNKKRIKISTFKIDDDFKSLILSEAIINIIFSEMDKEKIYECYVTMYKDKQKALLNVLFSWGFLEVGTKNNEIVMVKMKNTDLNDVKKNYKWYFN